MTLDEIDSYCLGLPGCSVRYPFERSPSLRAWCIGKKMFAWTVTNNAPLTVQVKASPELIPTLIANYQCINPGYHMSKNHWITILTEDCEDTLLRGILEDAHSLIAHAMPRAERLRLLGD